MPRPKRTSKVLDKANRRAAGLASIDPDLNLGEGLTLAKYRDTISDAQAKLDRYNTLLSQTDEALNTLQAAEKALSDLSDRMLAGVGAKYGKNSDEYEKAGGVRKSERKRPTRKTPIK
jgi:hypothetical protein